MSRRIAVNQLFSLLILIVVASAVGCNSYPPNLGVQLDFPNTDRKKVEVDVLATNDAQWQHYLTMPMTDYWKWGGEGRTQKETNPLCRVFQLSTQLNESTATILKDDPIWQKWTADPTLKHLVVIADLSNINGSTRDTVHDPRRAQLVLDKKKLKYPQTITIFISPGGISFSPFQKVTESLLIRASDFCSPDAFEIVHRETDFLAGHLSNH